MLYAKQVAPEYQESPLFLCDDCFPENIILTGNRDYKSHTTPEFDQIAACFDDMAGAWENDRYFFRWNGAGYDKIPQKPEYTLQELLTEYGFTRPDGKPWTTKQRHAWRELLEGEEGADSESVVIAALFLLTGERWKAFETEYFNTGSEWIIHDEDGEPESPEEINGYSVYCHGWNSDQIRKEIADAAGETDPAAVVLYEFTGWSRSPEYKKAV